MASSSGRSYRFTSNLGDYYPLTQFEQLSHRVSHQKSKHDKTPISPREEIYLSLLKEIRSKEAPKLDRLVKKASGILRLSHLKPDIESKHHKNGYEAETVNSSRIPRSRINNSKIPPAQTSLEPMGFINMRNAEVISRLVANGGDFSEIWDDMEAIKLHSDLNISRNRPPSRQSNMSRTSTTSRDTNQTNSSHVRNTKPPWRHFGNQNGLSMASNSKASLVSSPKSTTSSISVASTETVNSKSKWSRSGTANTLADKKADYMKHVFVINGKVVTFKGQGFENFNNWFGDIGMLSKDVSRTSRLQREFNLAGFNSREIRMKLYEGHKLVIEAYRSNRDKLPPLRFKETIILPKGVSVEELIMCRYESGRLIVQDVGRKET